MMKRTHHATTGAAALVFGMGLVAALTGCTDKKTTTPVETSSRTDGSSQPSVTSTPSTGTEVAEVQGPPAPQPPVETIDPKTAWKEGVQSYQSGDFATASSRLRVAVDSRQDDPYAHYLFGLALWKSGQLDEAEGEMVRSTTLNDQSIKTWINLARVRLERKEFDSALEAADRAVTIDAQSSDALHQRGRALDGLNRGDEAVATLQQARSIAPDNGYIANTLGYLLLRRGQTEEAVPLLEAARDRLPQVAFVRNNLGVAYERQGDVHKAAEEFRAALQAGDSEGKASASLARIEPLLHDRLASQPLPEEQNPPDQPQN
jgi:Flp pilus assembly protein TadD